MPVPPWYGGLHPWMSWEGGVAACVSCATSASIGGSRVAEVLLFACDRGRLRRVPDVAALRLVRLVRRP